MTEPSAPLTALSEDQRAQTHSRFTIIRPSLEDGVTQAQVARTHNFPASTGTTGYYPAPVTATASHIEREVMALSASLAYVVEAAENASRGKMVLLIGISS